MTKDSPPKKRPPWPKLVLLVGGAILALLALESAYRVKLYCTLGHIPLGMSATYMASAGGGSRFDRQFGYALLPNQNLLSVRITDGYPVMAGQTVTNAMGNIGPLKPNYESADIKILVIGDSYTAAQRQGDVWPSLMQDQLEQRLSKDVNALNFGRDGYGILQMFDLASAKTRQLEPDLVLIAFVAEDLNRARFWSVHRTIAGSQQGYITTEPSQDADLRSCLETGLIHPGVTLQWSQKMLETREENDPVLVELNQRFERIKQRWRLDLPVNYFSLSTSFLYDRVAYQDPFFHVPQKRQIPRLAHNDFAKDEQFLRRVAELNDTNIPYLLIMLPRHVDLQSGRSALTSQQKKLLASLQEQTSHVVISLLDKIPSDQPYEELFMLPHDRHPSHRGLEAYAEAIASILAERFSDESKE